MLPRKMETVVLAVQQPTILLLCWPACGEASTGAGTKKPLTSSSSMVLCLPHKSGKNYEGRTYNSSHVYVYRTWEKCQYGSDDGQAVS